MACVGHAVMQRVQEPQWFLSGASGSSSSVVMISPRKIQLPRRRLMSLVCVPTNPIPARCARSRSSNGPVSTYQSDRVSAPPSWFMKLVNSFRRSPRTSWESANRANMATKPNFRFPVSWLRIFVVDQGTVALGTDASQDLLRRRPQAGDERVQLEAGQVVRVRRQAAAGGDDRLGAAGQFLHDLLFQGAKRRFPIGVENIRDGAAGAGLDRLVRVEVIEVQHVGHKPAHGRLARAHETDERDVDELAGVVHCVKLAQASRWRNLKCKRGTRPPQG